MSAPDFAERARILASKAEEDAVAVDELLGNDHISDRIVGFHAQQAVEKFLKAVIASRGETYAPRHDIDYLVDLLEETPGDGIPTERDLLSALTIYAVPLRYEELSNTEPLDRTATKKTVDQMAAWAREQLP